MGAAAVAAACEALEHRAGEGCVPAPEELDRLAIEVERAGAALRSRLSYARRVVKETSNRIRRRRPPRV